MKKRSGASLFLIEYIIMLAVFVACAAVAAVLLARAHTLTAEAINLDYAVEKAVSVAECYKATGSGEAVGMELKNGVWEGSFNESSLAEGGKAPVLDIKMAVSDGTAKIEVYIEDEIIYSLDVRRGGL